MNEKIMWEDMLPKKSRYITLTDYKRGEEEGYNKSVDDCLVALKKSEAEGKICINPPESVFINHIKSHLKEGEFVICKICGKDVAEIYAEHLLYPNG